jgi:hypothetical protein
VNDNDDARLATVRRDVGVSVCINTLPDRYADSVVLTFAEIEDLLGFTLPDAARLEQGWWANADPDRAPSPQSRSWTQANRTATPRLLAQVVVFERTSD